jgi:hypothetical protein
MGYLGGGRRGGRRRMFSFTDFHYRDDVFE